MAARSSSRSHRCEEQRARSPRTSRGSLQKSRFHRAQDAGKRFMRHDFSLRLQKRILSLTTNCPIASNSNGIWPVREFSPATNVVRDSSRPISVGIEPVKSFEETSAEWTRRGGVRLLVHTSSRANHVVVDVNAPIAVKEPESKRATGIVPENLFSYNHTVLKDGIDPNSTGMVPSKPFCDTVKRSDT